jgi:hypothetical protein
LYFLNNGRAIENSESATNDGYWEVEPFRAILGVGIIPIITIFRIAAGRLVLTIPPLQTTVGEVKCEHQR